MNEWIKRHLNIKIQKKFNRGQILKTSTKFVEILIQEYYATNEATNIIA